ncbi:MAG: isochorismate synthase [bacterium]
MATNARQFVSAALVDARDSLGERLSWLQARLGDEFPRLPLTLSCDAPVDDLLGWLAGQTDSPRVYWASRDGGRELAGIGEAFRIDDQDDKDNGGDGDVYGRIERVLQTCQDESVQFIGGATFSGADPDNESWSAYSRIRHTLPEVLLRRDGFGTRMTICQAVSAADSLDPVWSRFCRIIDRLDFRRGETDLPLALRCLSRWDTPDRNGWIKNVEAALTAIQCEQVEKVVLARRTGLRLDRVVDPVAALASLARVNSNCYGFLYEPAPGTAFVSLTPERLFRCHGRAIESEAVSGTAARAAFASPGIGNGLSTADLLDNEKNRREHDFVRQFVSGKLHGLCDGDVAVTERALLRLSNVAHIHSRLTGCLGVDVGLAEVVASLHPTPAVCGTPPSSAAAIIAELEPFARGWYAGPVGICGHDSCELSVAIRSALIHGDTVELFVGAGIVRGSDPQREWRELEVKIAPALRTLAADQQGVKE